MNGGGMNGPQKSREEGFGVRRKTNMRSNEGEMAKIWEEGEEWH